MIKECIEEIGQSLRHLIIDRLTSRTLEKW